MYAKCGKVPNMERQFKIIGICMTLPFVIAVFSGCNGYRRAKLEANIAMNDSKLSCFNLCLRSNRNIQTFSFNYEIKRSTCVCMKGN